MTTLDQEINQRLMADPQMRRMFQSIMPRSPSYRYYENKETKDRYFWTTEKINHKGSPRYVSGIYRYVKTKKMWKPLKKAGSAKKYKAKNRAWILYQKEKTTSPEVA